MHKHYEDFKAGYDEHCERPYGLFRPDGTFYCLPPRESKELEEIFRAKVLAILKGESRINEPEAIERILAHLGLWKQHPPPHKNKVKTPAHEPPMTEDIHDGWPGYEEPALICH
jgi:hypothetical protein